MDNFVDEIRVSPNKMNIKILSQSADTMVAEITPAYTVQTPGTPINAAKMNELKGIAEQSSSKAAAAQTVANSASSTANTANTTATNAKTQAVNAMAKAQQAMTTATEAKATADNALQQVVNKQGSIVTVNGQYKESFEANDKLDKTVFNSYKTSTENSINSIKTNVETLKSQVATLQTQVTALQNEIKNMKNGTSVFTLLKANTLDLV